MKLLCLLEGEYKTPLATCPVAGHTLSGIMSWYFCFFQVRERIILNYKGVLITNYVAFRDIAESMVRDSLEETIRGLKPHISHSNAYPVNITFLTKILFKKFLYR